MLNDKETLKSVSPESLYGNNYGGNYGGGSYVTSHSSVGQQISNAFGNVVLGMVLFFLGFPVLYFNEFRQAKMWELFGRAASITRPDVSPDSVDASNEKGLVHVSGVTTNADTISDPLFNISVTDCAKLGRTAEMYLWKEHKEQVSQKDTNTGGSDTTYKYSYSMEWCSSHQDSSSFHEKYGHENPPKMELSSDSWIGDVVKLGAFTLPRGLKDKLCNSRDCTAEASETPCQANNMLRMRFRRVGGWLSTEQSWGGPKIGDYRVSFSKVPCGPTTVLAVQNNDTFVEMGYTAKVDMSTYTVDVGPGGPGLGQPLLEEGAPPQQRIGIAMNTEQGSSNPCAICPCCAMCSCVGQCIESGESVFEIEERNCSAQDILGDAGKTQNRIHKLLMFVGWLFMVVGIYLMLAVIPALFRIIPFIGTYIQAFGNFVCQIAAFLLGSFFSLIAIAVGWISVRPRKSAVLLAVALIVYFLPSILDAAGIHIG